MGEQNRAVQFSHITERLPRRVPRSVAVGIRLAEGHCRWRREAVLTAGCTAPIFGLTEEHAAAERAKMLELYNMGIGFRAIADPTKTVRRPRHKLIGSGKRFGPA